MLIRTLFANWWAAKKERQKNSFTLFLILQTRTLKSEITRSGAFFYQNDLHRCYYCMMGEKGEDKIGTYPTSFVCVRLLWPNHSTLEVKTTTSATFVASHTMLLHNATSKCVFLFLKASEISAGKKEQRAFLGWYDYVRRINYIL